MPSWHQPVKIGTFTYKEEAVDVLVGMYENNSNTAIILDSSQGPYAVLSVNTDNVLPSGKFVATHNVPEDLLKFLLTMENPLFEDTKDRVRYGYVSGAPVLKLSEFALGLYEAAIKESV